MIDIDLGPFLAVRRHTKIAHHIPGRVRLRVGPSVFKELGGIDASMFDRILGAIDGIKDVRVNKAAGSVVIAYAPEAVDPATWETLIAGNETTALSLLTSLLNGNAPGDGAAEEQS